MTIQGRTDELTALNVSLADWEQRRDPECVANLNEVLSPALIFRRADGTVIDKDAFMLGLQKPSPFTHRASHDVVVKMAGDRALVTLLVVGTKADGSVGRYRNVRLFFHRDARWQLEFWFNDDVTEAPAGR